MALADTARLIAALELQDKFSATAAKYEKTLGSMERKTSTLEKVGFQVGRGARNAVDNVKTIGVIAGGFVASQVALGVRSLAQLEEVKNQTDAVLKSTGNAANVNAEQIRAQAEALEDLSTVDDKVIQAGQNMLLTFTNVRNEVGEGNDIFNQATETLLDMSVALGTEPKQAAIQLGKALNDPIRGITALRRVGVAFTEDQEKQIKKLVESNRTLEAQKIIIEELNKEFGGSAKAFGEGPGATMRRFGDAVEGAQQALATGFLPVMEKVSSLVQTTLKDPKVLANIEKFGEGLAGGVENLIDIGMNLPWDAIGNSAKLMGQGAKALLDAFTGLPPWVQTAVLTGWGLNKLTGGALGNIAATLGKAAFGALRGSTPATPVFTKEVGVPGGGGPGGPAGGGKFGFLAGLLGTAAVSAELAGGFDALDSLNKNLENNALDLNAVVDLMSPAGLIGRGIDALLGIDRKPLLIGGSHATPTGQFDPANRGGVPPPGTTPRGTPTPVRVTNASDIIDPVIFKALGAKIERQEKAVTGALKHNDLADARRHERRLEALHNAQGTIRDGFTDLIPHLGETNRALSVANRNLVDGNARQRETAQRVAEARDRIGNGFTESNAKLGVISQKDFSPNIGVTVNSSTSVSVSDVIRSVTHASFASQVRHGFTEGNP